MKFHHFFTLFIVLVFLIFPPILVSPINQEDSINYISNSNRFSIFTIVISTIWSILLFFLAEKKEEKFTRNSLRISLLSFILIFYISFILQQTKLFFGFSPDKMIYNLSKIDKILSCIQIVVLCIYEEILYRKFLQTKIELLLENFLTKADITKYNLSEIISIFFVAILFALAHLYSGIFNAIFAFLASLIFSLCYKKTKNIIFPIISHSLFNLLVFLSLTKF